MTNPRELVERLEARLRMFSQPPEAPEKLVFVFTRPLDGDERSRVGRAVVYALAEEAPARDAIEARDAEITRLRGLLEEARGAAERIAKQSAWKTIEAPYSLRTKLDQAQDAASSLLKRLEDATSTPSGQ